MPMAGVGCVQVCGNDDYGNAVGIVGGKDSIK